MKTQDISKKISNTITDAINETFDDLYVYQMKRWFNEDSEGRLVAKHERLVLCDHEIDAPRHGLEKPVGLEVDSISVSLSTDGENNIIDGEHEIESSNIFSDMKIDIKLKSTTPSEGLTALHRHGAAEIRNACMHINPELVAEVIEGEEDG